MLQHVVDQEFHRPGLQQRQRGGTRGSQCDYAPPPAMAQRITQQPQESAPSWNMWIVQVRPHAASMRRVPDELIASMILDVARLCERSACRETGDPCCFTMAARCPSCFP